MRHHSLRHRRAKHQLVQRDLFGPDARPMPAPQWHQLPQSAQTQAMHLLTRLLIAHADPDRSVASPGVDGHD